MTDNEIIKAFDILDKFEFFGGQRAGRELWSNKPSDIQDEDIEGFLRDLDFLRQFINRQKAEIEDLREIVYMDRSEAIKKMKAEAVKEFAEKLKEEICCRHYNLTKYNDLIAALNAIDNLVKEFTEGVNNNDKG